MQARFMLLGVLSLLSLLLLLFILAQNSKTARCRKKESAFWHTVLSSRPILGVALFRVVYALSSTPSFGSSDSCCQPPCCRWATSRVGTLISLNVLIRAVLQSPCGCLSDHMSKATLIGIGSLISGASLAGFPLASTFWRLLVLNALVGAGCGPAYPAHMALAMEHTPGSSMGTVMSILLTVRSLGMTIAPPVFGLVVDYYNLSSML